ncbi:MAG TPA: hypothetical protein DCY20_11400 [Firmicutes bacterium]|nr:hypothetical protein [Bacillota bacterium]
MFIAYILILIVGGLMIMKPKKIIHMIKGPLVPQNTNIEDVWLYKLRYIGWFVLAAGIFGIINLFVL